MPLLTIYTSFGKYDWLPITQPSSRFHSALDSQVATTGPATSWPGRRNGVSLSCLSRFQPTLTLIRCLTYHHPGKICFSSSLIIFDMENLSKTPRNLSPFPPG